MKLENEMTVKITCRYDELTSLLLQNGFEIINEVELIDTYMVKNEVDVLNTPNSDLLSDYLIVRVPHNNNPQITYKYKRFNEDGSIREQGKINCDVHNKDEAHNLLSAIGYKELITLRNQIKFYKKGEILFVAAEVNDEYICLEYSGTTQTTIEEVIEDFETNYGFIPHDKTNYFINKAFIELDKIKSSNQVKAM